MAGFRNDVVYGINVDFSGKAIPAATITTDNQILVGTTATNADGSHVQVGVLTAGTNVTIDNTVLADGKLTINASGSGSGGLTQLFFANNSTDLSGVTGDGTSYDVIFDNLTYGQTGSGYDTTTGIFTAPSTGWYFFTYRLGLSGITGSHTACNCDLVTTDTYGLVYRTLANPAAIKDSGNDCTIHDAQIVYLEATQTIKIEITVYSGTKDIGIIGPQSTVQFYSTFTGAKFA